MDLLKMKKPKPEPCPICGQKKAGIEMERHIDRKHRSSSVRFGMAVREYIQGKPLAPVIKLKRS